MERTSNFEVRSLPLKINGNNSVFCGAFDSPAFSMTVSAVAAAVVIAAAVVAAATAAAVVIALAAAAANEDDDNQNPNPL